MSYKVSRYPVEKLEPNADIQPGFAFKSERFTDISEDIPLVKGENVHQGYIDWRGAKHWPANEYGSFAKYHLMPGDVVLAMDRPWVTAGLKWSYIKPHDPKSLLVQRVARLRAKKKLCQDYLRHVISSNYFANYLKPIVTGVNVPHISGKQIGAFHIPIPEPEIQRKIAAILTAYDDLIETNKRRIALLEKMAEELYREWFVRMRFPGHQHTKCVKGVPEGWEMRQVERAFDFTGGGTPSKNIARYWSEGGVNWFTPSDITGAAGAFLTASAEQCTEEGLARSSARLFPAYSVMMTSRATIGAIGINTTPACTNQGFITCVPNERYTLPYLFHWLKLAKPYFEQLCGGATFPELTKGTFKKLRIPTPPRHVMENFTAVAMPMFGSIESGLSQNSILTRTRDLLLPRLISGKLSVEDLDIQFPPSMREET